MSLPPAGVTPVTMFANEPNASDRYGKHSPAVHDMDHHILPQPGGLGSRLQSLRVLPDFQCEGNKSHIITTLKMLTLYNQLFPISWKVRWMESFFGR